MVCGWRNGARSVAGLVGTLLLAACTSGPGREDQLAIDIVKRACERAFECGCADEDSFFFSDCEELALELTEDDEPLPYAFDAECGQAALEQLNSASCDDPFILTRADVCPLYFGTLLEGAPCGDAIRDDEDDDPSEVEQICGRGLACVRGGCMAIATIPYGTEGFPCEFGGGCDVGLSCRGSCIQLPTPGQLCLDGECSAGARCSFDGGPNGDEEPVCVALASVGDSCMGHAECSTLNCPAGFCEPAASTGLECGPQLPCGPGLACVDGVCDLPNSCGLFLGLSPGFF